MNREEILQRLRTQIVQLNSQFETISNTEGKIAKLEMDRMLSDIRATYELFTVLSYVNTYPPVEKTAGPVIQQEKQPAVSVELPKEEPRPEVTGIREEIKPETKPAEVHSKTEKIVKTLASKEEKIVEAYRKDKPQSLYEKHAENPTGNVAGKFMQQKIEDLKKAIPLHEKFHYINELFRGENGYYNEFLEEISKSGSWEDASKLFEVARNKFGWDLNGKAYQKFSDLIRRKF